MSSFTYFSAIPWLSPFRESPNIYEGEQKRQLSIEKYYKVIVFRSSSQMLLTLSTCLYNTRIINIHIQKRRSSVFN